MISCHLHPLLDIIIHSTHYLFSDWPKAYREFSNGRRFFSVSAAIIRKDSAKRPWNENGEGPAVHSSTRPSGAIGEWRVSSWLAISNSRENILYFFLVCCSGFSQGWKSLYNTVVYMIKTFAARTTSKMMPPWQDHEDFSSKIFSYIGVQFFRYESK